MRSLLFFIVLIVPLSAFGQTPHRDVRVITVTPVVDTSQYASGDDIGGIMTFTGLLCGPTKTGTVESIVITDKNNQAVEYDVVIFSSNPTSSTTTCPISGICDQQAFKPTDADLAYVNPFINIQSTDRSSFSDNGMSSLSSLRSTIKSNSTGSETGNAYVALVSRGTPTYATAGDVSVRIAVGCD